MSAHRNLEFFLFLLNNRESRGSPIAFPRGREYASRRSFLKLAPIRRTALETTDDELEHEPPNTPYSAVSLFWSQ
jgi:hypothetical protein